MVIYQQLLIYHLDYRITTLMGLERNMGTDPSSFYHLTNYLSIRRTNFYHILSIQKLRAPEKRQFHLWKMNID